MFGNTSGSDLVLGFSQSDGDRLDLQVQTYTANAANGSTVLTLSGGGMITLSGVSSVDGSYIA